MLDGTGDFFTAVSTNLYKDWIFLVLSLVLGLALSSVFRLARWMYRYTSSYKKLGIYVGKWNVYHWSREGYEGTFRHSTWDIRRGFLSQLQFCTAYRFRTGLLYTGKLRFESGHVVIDMVAKAHREETLQIRIQPEPIPGDHRRGIIMRGIALDQDFDQEVYAATYLISRREQKEETVKRWLKAMTYFSLEQNCLRLKRRPLHPRPAEVDDKGEAKAPMQSIYEIV